MIKNNLNIKSFFFRKEQPKVNFGNGKNSPLLISEETIEGFEIKTSEEDKADYEQQRKEILTRELQLLKNSQSRLSIKNNAFLVFENKLLDIASNEKIVSGSIEQSIDELMRIEIIKKMLCILKYRA